MPDRFLRLLYLVHADLMGLLEKKTYGNRSG
jgi:hypothetical protein